ncbi:MAG: GNAT family N-acetyltransferase [Tannerellaceae bacterium]|jgi:predicted acetyltransferase|nr:GNAT family N-acetyltransferase [Tannerellaceae bacterium]
MKGGQVSKLWRLCFQDNEAFIRLFFNKFYCSRRTFSVVQKGRVVSALQVLPYALTSPVDDTIFRLAYIAGCCTHPDYRGRGYMRRLLATAVAEAREQGFDLAALIPASTSLFDYYGALGFTTSCFFTHVTYLMDKPVADMAAHRFLRLNGHTAARFYPFFARCFQQRKNCIQLNNLQFRAAVTDINLDDGAAYLLQKKSNGAPLALAFVLPTPPDTLHLPAIPYVKEIVATDKIAGQTILTYILKIYRTSTAICRTPLDRADGFPAIPYGMTLPLSDRFSMGSKPGIYINLMLD